jgi:hypothetical protein
MEMQNLDHAGGMIEKYELTDFAVPTFFEVKLPLSS